MGASRIRQLRLGAWGQPRSRFVAKHLPTLSSSPSSWEGGKQRGLLRAHCEQCSSLTMRLNQRNVDIFFATIPAFVASLPPAPDRNEALEDDVTLALANSIVNLRFEFTRLCDSFSIDWAVIELPEKDCADANTALEDILDMLNCLVDGLICGNHQNLVSFTSRKPPKICVPN